MSDIKSYKPASAFALYQGSFIVHMLMEKMQYICRDDDKLSMDMVRKKLRASHFLFESAADFDRQSLDSGEYDSPGVVDFYGR